MRKLIPLAVLAMAVISTKAVAHSGALTDSTKIIHANDGDISEWGADKFETDPETKVQYAVDHDAGYLFMAMKIADPQMQMRVCFNGMKMFIDTRGKKKEGTGIEFPIRKEGGGFRGGDANEGGDEKAKMQQRMSFNLIVLKTFGFDDQEDKTHFIGEAGSANVAYKFNTDGSLSIEYKVPVEFIGGPSSVKNKTLSIGWKINEAGAARTNYRQETESTGSIAGREVASSTRRAGGAGAVSSSAGGRGGGPSGETRVGNEEPKGQFIWTKHLVNF